MSNPFDDPYSQSGNSTSGTPADESENTPAGTPSGLPADSWRQAEESSAQDDEPSYVLRDRWLKNGTLSSDAENLDQYTDDFISQQLGSDFNKIPDPELLNQYQQVQPYVADYLQNQEDFHAWKKEREHLEGQRKAEEPPTREWKYEPLEELDPSLQNMVKLDPETGRYVPGPYATPDAATKLNHYREESRRRAEAFTRNPEEFIWEVVQSRVNELVGNKIPNVDERIEQYLTQRQARQETEGFWDKHADVLLKHDDQGNVIYRQDGSAVLSDQGTAYWNAVTQAREEFGIEDPAKQLDFAKKVVGELQRDTTRNQEKHPDDDTIPPHLRDTNGDGQNGKDVADQQKQRFMDRVPKQNQNGNGRNRNGTQRVADYEGPPRFSNQGSDWDDLHAQAMREHGE